LKKKQNVRNNKDRDQTDREFYTLNNLPEIKDLCAAILQLRRECTDIRARDWFGRKHRHEQRNKAAWNTCRLQLFNRQSLRVLARANLFDSRAFERRVAGKQIPEGCA